MLLAVTAGSCYPVRQGSVLCEGRTGALGILSCGWVSHHLHDCLLGSPLLWLSHCAWNTEETALNIAFLLLHGGRSADNIGTRLEVQWERNFHSAAWCNWAFSHHSFPWSLLAWEPEFLGPKSSLTYLQLRWVIHPRVQFPISWMRETGLPPEHLFQTEAQCQSVEKWLSGRCCWGRWGCLWWAGLYNCLVMFMVLGSGLGVVDHLAHSCCDTEDLRGLAHRNLPSLGSVR